MTTMVAKASPSMDGLEEYLDSQNYSVKIPGMPELPVGMLGHILEMEVGIVNTREAFVDALPKEWRAAFDREISFAVDRDLKKADNVSKFTTGYIEIAIYGAPNHGHPRMF